MKCFITFTKSPSSKYITVVKCVYWNWLSIYNTINIMSSFSYSLYFFEISSPIRPRTVRNTEQYITRVCNRLAIRSNRFAIISWNIIWIILTRLTLTCISFEISYITYITLTFVFPPSHSFTASHTQCCSQLCVA